MRWLAMWAVVTVLVLLSVDVSTATRNPLHHPQQNHGSSNCNRNVHVVGRGGSTILQPPPQDQQQYPQAEDVPSSRALLEQPPIQYQQQVQQQQQEPMVSSNNNNPTSFLPRVRLEQITKALLHTSDWNKRLLRGIKHWGKHKRINLVSASPPSAQPSIAYANGLPNNNYQQQSQHQQHSVGYQNYGSLPVNVHPSRTWEPPIEQDSGRSLEEEELTLFHAKTSNEARSWGPDLLPYLKHVADVLELDDDGSIELVLAMIYLDRACSVDTPRSNGVAHCPFVQPRTVHRLGLAALVVAKSVTSRQNQDHLVEKLSTSLGIPKEQLQLMVEWMLRALGDDETYVGVQELHSWSKIWKKFVSKFKL